MSEDLNRELLQEIKRLNDNLETLNSSKGLSTPLKFVALILGFFLIPIVIGVITYIINLI